MDHDIGRLASFVTVPSRCLQWRASQRRRTAECIFGQHGGQPVHRRGVGNDQPGREVFDVGQLCGDGQRLDVAGTIEELVLERQVIRQRLLERFGLLGQGFGRRTGAAQDRSQNVGKPPRSRIAVSTPRSRLLGDGVGAGMCPRNSPVGWSDKTSTSTSPTQTAAPP